MQVTYFAHDVARRHSTFYQDWIQPDSRRIAFQSDHSTDSDAVYLCLALYQVVCTARCSTCKACFGCFGRKAALGMEAQVQREQSIKLTQIQPDSTACVQANHPSQVLRRRMIDASVMPGRRFLCQLSDLARNADCTRATRAFFPPIFLRHGDCFPI